MRIPNLASSPFLNTRPAYLLTFAALVGALALGGINAQIYMSSSQELAEQLEYRDQLEARHNELREAVLDAVEGLEKVEWGPLRGRAMAMNSILKEHAFSWLELLDHVENVLPYQVKVVSIAPSINDGEVSIQIRAIAKNRGAMLELMQNLIDDPHFEKQRPTRELWPESTQTVEYLFSIEMTYLPEAS